MQSLVVVLPMFNDWQSAARVVEALKSKLAKKPSIAGAKIMIVDDGSTEQASSVEHSVFTQSNIAFLTLPGNVGHQRAVVAGIRHAIEEAPDYILVMDADGEDRPDAVASLIDRAELHPDCVIAARRGTRFENLSFRMLYGAHKTLFRLLTGERLDFGNFVLLPLAAARKIAQMPEVSSHLAAAILKSRLPIHRVTADRGKRHFGDSKMNMERLISHSFSSLSTFAERIMVRLVVFSFFATLVSVLAAITVVVVRFFSESATPGWATAALGLLVVFSLQFLSFAGLGTLITLNVFTLRNHLQGENIESESSHTTPVFPKPGNRGHNRPIRASRDSM